jgi:hypothetical protein
VGGACGGGGAGVVGAHSELQRPAYTGASQATYRVGERRCSRLLPVHLTRNELLADRTPPYQTAIGWISDGGHTEEERAGMVKGAIEGWYQRRVPRPAR